MEKESSKSKNTQTGTRKQRDKKLNTLGGYAGRVMVGNRRSPICIPAGTSKVVVGRMQNKLPKGSYMVEATDDDNLPCGVSVNHTYVNPTKAKQVSIILLTPIHTMFGLDNCFMPPLFGMSNLRTGTMSPLSPKVKKQIRSRLSYSQYHQRTYEKKF